MSKENSTTEKEFTLAEKIEYEIYDQIHPADNRCWWTCFCVIRKLKQSEKKHVRFIEGTIHGSTHYWLEVDGRIFDPHYELLGFAEWDFSREGRHLSDDGRVVERAWSGDQIKIDWDAGWEPRWCESLEREVRVRQLLLPEEM
tara:strand:+ start:113 stop:541 length:429 start_codon:yes stop_codon:yes gene_type:complete